MRTDPGPTAEERALAGTALHPGAATGKLCVLEAPLSFWGGTDVHTGRITDEHHPQCGTVLSGRVVALPSGRGSSSSASVLAEAIRAGTAPAALILGEPDAIIALGALVAAELYERRLPVMWLRPDVYAALPRHRTTRVGGGTHVTRVAHVTAGDTWAAVNLKGMS